MNTETAHNHRREFGGPVGTLILTLGLPLIVYYLYYTLRFNEGNLVPSGHLDVFLASIIPTFQAAAIYLAWFFFQALLQAILPGRIEYGKKPDSGERLPYRMNGLLSIIVTFIVLVLLYITGILPGTLVYDHLGSLISVTIIFSFLYSFFLYFYGKRIAPESERTGNPFYDFFMGTARNPRIGSFDLKFFSEARPGLIGWVVVNLSFMAAQHQAHGFISLSMILVVAMQAWYIVDYYLHEPAILTTMDIAHENFGYMLAFGDLAWVPFTYTLQALYLVHHPVELPIWAAVLIFGMHLVGYYIFREVNIQKHRFRTDPARPIWGKKPDYIETERGTHLLLSGFWGWSRHFNYVGDILMAFSWSLPTLFNTPVTYFYPVYFTILLIHRERRDNYHCRQKYGKDWDRYCEKVPWRIIPGIY